MRVIKQPFVYRRDGGVIWGSNFSMSQVVTSCF